MTSVLVAALACERLLSLTLSHASVTIAQPVTSGVFEQARELPPFCRVAVTLKPSSDSDIKMELWLPAEKWNGKFQEVGNGAFSGSIAYAAMANALRRGYAAASTDTGHTGNTASFGLGHPEKVIDFGWRAIHETAAASKALVTEFYGRAPAHAYFTGCSAGGRQALKEAQKFPADFDGIVAGAPGLDWTGRASQAVRVAQVTTRSEESRITPADALRLHDAVLAACDARDGVKDGVVEDPTSCSVDPAVAGLSAAKTATARLLYAALMPGSELGWTDLGWTASARATGRDQFRYLVFGDPAWDVDRFDFERDAPRAEKADDNTINALDPDLKDFFARGGKLIQYHGWNDPQISPLDSTKFYARVIDALGKRSLDAPYRLFMAPGMAHCGGGEGPNSFDALGALEAWVEHGQVPDRLVASRVVDGKPERTRPLCPYPLVAEYKGSGGTDAAANFVCRTR